MIDLENLVFKLCKGIGVSGGEKKVSNIAVEQFEKYCKVSTDKNGNIYAVCGNLNSKKNIMIDAHIDQIGLVVTNIDSLGFIKVAACGGIDSKILLGSTVKVCGKQEILGIVCCMPPHLSNNSEEKNVKVEDIYIDTGIAYNKIKDKVSLGDYVTFYNEPKKLLNNRITSPALDNRASVTTLIKCAEKLSKIEDLPCKVTILLSVQEETSALGANTAAYFNQPDEALVVDVSFASQPDVAKEKTGNLSKGPMIGIAPSISKGISNKLINLAVNNNIPYQLEIMASKTGTNCDEICKSRAGIPSGVVSIPLRYMHTPIEIVDLKDIENTAKLLVEYIKSGGLIND